MTRPGRQSRARVGLALLAGVLLLALPACRGGGKPSGGPEEEKKEDPGAATPAPGAGEKPEGSEAGTEAKGEKAAPESELVPGAAFSRVEGKGGAPGEEPPVVVEVLLDKTRLTLGEVLTLSLSVDRAAGVEVKLPDFKKYGRFEVTSVTESEAPGRAGRVVLIRTYKLQGFAVGAYRLPGIPVRYTDVSGRWRQTRTERFYVWIGSVIPAGEEPEDILGIKPQMIIEIAIWLFKALLAAVAVLVLAGIVTWIVFRRRRKAFRLVAPKLAHDFALEELERLLKEGLIARGLAGRHYVTLHRILRRYLERRFQLACMERTSEEILVGMLAMRYFGQHTYEVANRFFTEADAVKFASYLPAPAEIEETLKNVYYFIELTRERPETGAAREAAEPVAGAAR